MDNIKISVSESGKDDLKSVIRVDGVIDTLTATQLEEVLDKLLKRGRFEIVLDLAGVDYISSAGWGIFISRIKEIRQNRGDIKLANMVPNVMEIYELLEFDNILSSYETVAEAKSSFNSGMTTSQSKKKAPEGSVRTTIEELPFKADKNQLSTGGIERRERKAVYSGSSAETMITDAVCQDPFYSISEIKHILSEKMLGQNPGWWGIFRILWKKGLITKRSRFRYARRHGIR